MYNFCTLFDSFYLSKGLAMYESLRTHLGSFHLYIFAFDDLSLRVLQKLNLQNVSVISLSDFETDELLNVKAERSKAEYCWTCTPSTIYYIITRYNCQNCTYIDADLIFYSDPSVLIEEMISRKKNVLITEHRYSFLSGLYEEKRAGRFCVQFMTFSNDSDSMKILDEWRLQCIYWCYARHEDGKFGDQKYLDVWPAKYPNIHILQHQGGGIAPWNLLNYKFSSGIGSLIGTVASTGESFCVVFFHFQYVKMISAGIFDLGWHYIPMNVKKLFYIPYLKKILNIENDIKKVDDTYNEGITKYEIVYFRSIIKIFIKKVFGYNMVNIN
jgi:hypothetical protein